MKEIFKLFGLTFLLGMVACSTSNTTKERTETPIDSDGKYELVWAEEFDQNTVDTTVWTYRTGAHGWGNSELQNYTAGANDQIVDGKLVITVKKEDELQKAGSYTSTRMVTKGTKEFTYGKIEARAKMPKGLGIWPAIWMLGSNIDSVGWPACGEIDIMEYVGFAPDTVYSTVHNAAGWGDNSDGKTKLLKTIEEDFHVYGIVWDENQILFYTDSVENVTHVYAPEKNADSWPYDKPHYLILNVAFGGNFGGRHGVDHSIFPQKMEVDYIRVYQKK